MNCKIKLSLLVAVSIFLLAGAAYLAMIYVVPNFSPTKGLSVSTGPGGKKTVSIKLAQATELPPSAPNASGALTEKKDNSLMVNNTGKGVSADNGVILEVVVTRATVIYKDVTFDNVSKSQIISGSTVQMQIAPATLEDIQVGDMVQAWGARTGDRVVAEQILVMQNVGIEAPKLGSAGGN